MSICPCGYWWEDLNEYGEPISLAYCHYDGPDEYAPCEQDSYDEYANEARIEEEAAAAEAEWYAEMEREEELMSEARWIHEFGQPYDYQEF